MGYQEVGFIYTREGRQPIRPPQTLPPSIYFKLYFF